MTDDPTSWRWASAKHDYLKGLPVARVCAGYNLPRSTFYSRAKREGWLRGDEALEAELNGELAPTPLPAPPTHELAQRALDRAAEAVINGDLRAAEGWARMVARLRALAVQEAVRCAWRGIAEDYAEGVKAVAAGADPLDDLADGTPRPTPADGANPCLETISTEPLDSPASPISTVSSNPYRHQALDQITRRLADIRAASRLPDPADGQAAGWEAEWSDGLDEFD